MAVIELNSNDKLRLRADIKISMVIGLFFPIALVILVGLIPAIMFVFGKRLSGGFVTRGLYIIGLLFLPFLAISWTNILRYIDLKKNKKLNYKTEDYEIVNKKDTAYILTCGDNKRKIKIDNELIPFIDVSQPLTIEVSHFAKSLLFISHGNDNLLNKLGNDKDE